jgi:hypothetical protein
VRLYRVNAHSAERGRIVGWATSKAKAAALFRTMAEDMGDVDEAASRIERVEIETDREGLCRWLNLHFNADNG